MGCIVNDKKVSIVIPVYNVADYLDECLESVVTQTYTNIEILLVNDGSTDDSLRICEKWAEKEERIIFFNNTNHGVSYTRNYAMDRCSGEYIVFVDSDDLVSKDYVRVLVDAIERTTADIAIASFSCFKDGTLPEFCVIQDDLVKKSDLEETFFTLTNGIQTSKIYKKNLIIQNNIRFAESIHVSEDLLFNIQYVKNCKSLTYNNSSVYGYRQRADSAIHDTVSLRWFTCLKVYKYLFENYADNSIYPFVIFYYLKFLYEAKYIICHKGVKKEEIETHVFFEIKRVEKMRGCLSFKQRIKLFVCKYLFFLIELKRR